AQSNVVPPPSAATLPTFNGLSPTTANYVFSPAGSSSYLAVGPFNLFTYQTASGTVGNFNYVSMTNNNYTPTLGGDPTNAANVNGYSVLTNLHQAPDGTLNYFTNALLQTGSENTAHGNNVWNAPLAYGTTTTLPVGITAFVAAPAYPAGYQLSTTVVPPSFLVKVTNGSAASFKLTVGGQSTSGLTLGASGATVQAALQAISSVGAGYCLVTGPGPGDGSSGNPHVYTVYFSNPALASTALTGTNLNSAGAPVGGLSITYQPSNLSLASIESNAFGRTAQINASTVRTETVVPFPIELFNSREGVYNGSITADPTMATTNPNWDAMY